MYKYKIYSVLVIILKIGVNYSILIIEGDDLMNIQNAIKKATQQGKAIMLHRDEMTIHLLPTNTTSAIIESVDNGKYLVYWKPTLADLVSDDWEVTDEFRLNQLPNDSAGPTGIPAILPEDRKRIQILEGEWYKTR